MANKHKADYGRVLRCVLSLFVLGFSLMVMIGVYGSQGLPPVVPPIVYLVFLIASAIVMTLILGRLYVQHELRRFNFDVANLLLMTVLVSLPFATAGIIWNLVEPIADADFKSSRTLIMFTTTGMLAFSLLPALLITEAILHWYTGRFRRRQP